MYPGVMSIYFYYKMSKQVTRLSLGKYSSLREIQLVQQLGELRGDMRYYYLQGWNGENPKLSYKGDYAPVEFMGRCVGPLWTEAPDNVALTPQSGNPNFADYTQGVQISTDVLTYA